jgi:hypothetical protein
MRRVGKYHTRPPPWAAAAEAAGVVTQQDKNLPRFCTVVQSLAKGGVETYLIERKMDNCKVRSEAGGRDGGMLCLQAGSVIRSLHDRSLCPFELRVRAQTYCTILQCVMNPRAHCALALACCAALRRRHPDLHGGGV